MSHTGPDLPLSPSIDQLRKQAKELLKRVHAGDVAVTDRFRNAIPRWPADEPLRKVRLAEAQFVLAREKGFRSWADLISHIESMTSSGQARFDKMAHDIVLAWDGDTNALLRLNEASPRAFTHEQFREMMRDRLNKTDASDDVAPTQADARRLVAQFVGFASWDDLVAATRRSGDDAELTNHGLSARPPFFRIDPNTNTLEPRQPLSNRDWDTLLGVMQERGLTGLNANGLMTDGVMKRVGALDQLRRLNLAGSKRLSDTGLKHLSNLEQLEELDLSGWDSKTTDKGLSVLQHLPNLTDFRICWARRITDSGIANLKSCHSLQSVDLMGTNTGDGSIAALIAKPALRRLKTGRAVTDLGIPLLHKFPVFKKWQGGEIEYGLMSADCEPNHLLLDGPITDAGLKAIQHLDGVFGLSFFWHLGPALTAEGLQSLIELPNLGFLGCPGALCDDTAMRHISAIPNLRMLMAQGTVATDKGFALLSRSQTLEYLWGRECPNLGSEGFRAIGNMPALRGLAVSCKQVDDFALATLPRFPTLQQLMPMDVPDDGFRHVGKCNRLTALWCMYCRDTGDSATEHVRHLSLKTYYAGKTRITDRSLETLAMMSSLQSLTFWECAEITDHGVAVLSQLPHLRELNLEGLQQVTRECVKQFPTRVRVNYT